MTEKRIFPNTALQNMYFADDGRDVVLHFSNTFDGRDFGEIHCKGVLELAYNSNGFLNYADGTDSLFPLFVRDVLLQETHRGYVLRIEAGLVIHIACVKVRLEQALEYNARL